MHLFFLVKMHNNFTLLSGWSKESEVLSSLLSKRRKEKSFSRGMKRRAKKRMEDEIERNEDEDGAKGPK